MKEHIKLTSAISMAVGMLLGNFIWQLATLHDWARAGDRSWFQGVAIMLLWWSVERRKT